MANKAIYIIDTCVLLHDPKSIHRFAEHDVCIPLAVIDDLDVQKTAKESVGWSAREAFRQLGKYDLEDLKDKGIKLGPNMGKLFVYNHEAPLSKGEVPNIVRTNSDNAIINACIALKGKYPTRKVCIVTKDMGLRLRAITWGCRAENYRHDLVDDNKFDGASTVEITQHKDWDLLTATKRSEDGYRKIEMSAVSDELTEKMGELFPNQFFIFRRSVDMECAGIVKRANIDGSYYIRILKDKGSYAFSGITPLNIEQKMAMEAMNDPDIQLIGICGAAGTGKTIAALAVALDQVDSGIYDRIVVIKPLVPVGGKDIGFLPGSKAEKISAWLGPIRDNLQQLVAKKRGLGLKEANDVLEEMILEGLIEVEAMTFLQGRSITDSVIIADETQNLTAREGRMLVERCGRNSKVVMLGDLSQVEHPYLDKGSCALAHAITGARKSDLAAAVLLTKVERSKLAAAASEIFATPDANR